MSPGKSAIEWTTKTWNPITGCSHVSAGCDNCYAARETGGRLKNRAQYEGLAFDGKFTGEIRLLPERLEEPLRWRKPALIFVNSMSDLFHADVPRDYIAHVFAVMSLAKRHTFQVLTKRPGRAKLLLSDHQFRVLVDDHREAIAGDFALDFDWPLPNVWLGTSVEHEVVVRTRVPVLLRTPAAVHFVSCEPLLGPIDLRAWLFHPLVNGEPAGTRLKWVICGGESGRGARAMHPAWARELRDQCVAAGVPFFFKQWGEWAPVPTEVVQPFEVVDGTMQQCERRFVADVITRVGKKKAGRELDGRTWDEMPKVLA